MKPQPDPSYRHRFPAEVISHAVWLYHVFSLSLRDVELLLAERGVVVSYESVRRWCTKFAASFADRMRRPRPQHRIQSAQIPRYFTMEGWARGKIKGEGLGDQPTQYRRHWHDARMQVGRKAEEAVGILVVREADFAQCSAAQRR